MSANASPGQPARPCGLEDLEGVWRGDGIRTHGCRLLDVRRLDAAPEDHLPGSAWVPWTSDRLPAFLLPARGRPVLLFGPHAEHCAGRLAADGWPSMWCTSEVPPAWFVAGAPSGALWDVDPLLRRHRDSLPDPAAGAVIDLGSGSSREGIFLAQQGYRVLLVDHLPDALDLARARARHHGVDHRIETRTLRLRREDDLPEGDFAVALILRFLQRDILRAIGPRLVDDGALVMRSFGKPIEGSHLVGRGPRNPTARLGIEEATSLLGDRWRWSEAPRLVQEDGALWVTAVGHRQG